MYGNGHVPRRLWEAGTGDMCGRYYMDPEAAEEIAGEAERRRPGGAVMKRSGEIRPGDFAPVLANDRRLTPGGFCMRWGYAGPRGLVFNARSETCGEKPMFRDGYLRRRCLIPLSRYFEWEKRGRERLRYALAPEGTGPFYLAGLYRLEDRIPVFTVLTRAPAPAIAFLHDRMPVLLARREGERWLDPGEDPGRILELAELNVSCVPDDVPIQEGIL